jgi:hypothetical protein
LPGVGHVEIDQVGAPLLGESAQKFVRQIAVRVEYGAAAARAQILPDQGLKEGGLAHAGLTEQVHVRPAVGLFDPEGPGRVAEVGPGKE